MESPEKLEEYKLWLKESWNVWTLQETIYDSKLVAITKKLTELGLSFRVASSAFDEDCHNVDRKRWKENRAV